MFLPPAAAKETDTLNPIGQLARTFNPRLVTLEQRVKWINTRLAALPNQREQLLRTALGCRGGKLRPGDPDPSVVIDLGREYPLESLFLIPAQREASDNPSLFPRKFTLEISKLPDFSQRMTVFSSGNSMFPSPAGKPVRFLAHRTPARYVRLTVHQGHAQGSGEIFTLSEIVAISGGEAVSFGADTTGTGTLSAPEIWDLSFLTDGRTPLGSWQSGRWTDPAARGDLVEVPDSETSVSWSLDLGEDLPIDRLILFPSTVPQVVHAAVLPDELHIQVTGSSGDASIVEWKSPIPGISQITPLIIPLRGFSGKTITISAIRPWSIGTLHVHSLSEIEVWSGGKNHALGLPVLRDGTTPVTSLTDGYASDRQIISASSWLNQLYERWRLENEMVTLQPVYSEMLAESELNATWGSAIALGLTFLIPVFIVERKRLVNRRQLEDLRKRIASDLHDDIGSNLGSISLIARSARKDLAKQGAETREEVVHDLGEVENIARESSLAMRDIVWLLERRSDSVGDLVQRMRDTANRLLRDVDYTLDCESCRFATKLSLDSKRHLFLFYKETIHNIFKHSQATRVSLKLWDRDDKFIMEICDNGIGFDTTARKTPVHKLEERSKVLGGQLDILSIPTKGTSIRLTVRRSDLIANTAVS